MTPARTRTFLIGMAMLTLLTGCIHDIPAIPAPPPTAPTTTTTGAPDFSAVDLRGVSGSTTTTSVPISPGQATITGIVTAADGFVAGAQVLVERLVGNGVGSMTLVSGADGRWALPGVLGGRYRVRAWRAPDLAVTHPYQLYLEAAQTVDVPVQMEPFRGLVAVPAINPDPPVVQEAANLVIQVATRRVDDQGIVISDPVPDVKMELYGGSAWQMQSSNPTFADTDGRGRWQVACMDAGHQPLSVVVGGDQAIPLAIADCALTAATTSTSSASGSTSTTRRSSSTSTTRRTSSTTSGSGSTTTTTRPSTTTTRSTSTTTRRPTSSTTAA